jgi:hypothetical protein
MQYIRLEGGDERGLVQVGVGQRLERGPRSRRAAGRDRAQEAL